MDSLERIRRLRDDYESSLDEAERLREEYHRAIVKLHRSGMSLREIANGLGISHQRVHQIVTPHEERPPSRKKRAIAAGGTVAIVLLTAGVGVFLAQDGAPTTERAGGSSSTSARPSSELQDRCPHLPFQKGCFGTQVVAIDPATGKILARAITPVAPGELAAQIAARQAERAQLHELRHQTKEQLRAQLEAAAQARAAAKAQAAALAAAAAA